MSFAGMTDENGRLLHEEVPPGNYELCLTVKYDEALELPPRQYKCPIIVLEADEGVPQIRLIGAVPRVVMFRVRGLVFDTNKTFILNSVIEAFKRIREVYEQNNPSELLLVGHTDTTAEPKINDPLSLKRADSVEQYLKDDVQAWLKNYSDSKPEKERWGAREDLQMIEAMAGYESKGPDVDPVLWYQTQHNLKPPARRKPKSELKADGKAGPQTREQLIHDYMQLDGATLRDHRDYDITITTHGCGENFPLDESGSELDQAPQDEKEDQLDRRVELFFFDKDFGIQPPPPGKNSKKGSKEYPAWRKRARIVEDFEAPKTAWLEARLHDAEVRPLDRGIKYRAKIGGVWRSGTAGEDGWVSLEVLVSEEHQRVTFEWLKKGGQHLYRRDLYVDCETGDNERQARAKLNNLGYFTDSDEDYEAAVHLFQRDYGIDEEWERGNDLPPRTKAKLKEIYDGDFDASTPPR
jgi:outer membrane protein OmpA-like peptidoglycan-associated protein